MSIALELGQRDYYKLANKRRGELIDKQISGEGLTLQEAVELTILTTFVDSVLAVNHAEQEGESQTVTLPDGSVALLDSEHAAVCRVCDKVFEPGDDSWDGIDASCADGVSNCMDDRNLTQEEAIEYIKKHLGG